MAEILRADPMKAELRKMLAAIQRRSAAERQLDEKYSSSADDTSFKMRGTLGSIESRFNAQEQAVRREHESSRSAAAAQFDAQHQSVRAEYDAALAEIARRYESEAEEAEREKSDASWMVTSVLDDQSHESPRFQFETFKKRLMTTKDRLRDQRRETDETAEAAALIMTRRRQMQDFGDPEPVAPARELEECESRFAEARRVVQQGRSDLQKQRLTRLFIGPIPALLFFLIWGALFFPIWRFVDPVWLKIEALQKEANWVMASAGSTAVIGIIVLSIVFGIARSRSSRIYEGVFQALAEAKACQKRWIELAKQELQRRQKEFEARYAEVVAKRDRSLANIESRSSNRLQEAMARRDQDRAEAERKYPAALNDIVRRRDEQLREIDNAHNKRQSELAAVRAREMDDTKQRTARSQADRSTSELRDREAVAGKWQASLSEFLGAVDEVEESNEATTPPWETLLAPDWTLPESPAPALRIGYQDFDLEQVPEGLSEDAKLRPDRTRIEIPVVLPFPAAASVLLKSSGAGRAVAADALRAMMLRCLTSLPPGKVRFTVIDPVGLGEEFSAFMHLADYDELMIGSRIWTEKTQIEKRLTDLSEHIENVFQAYLRNEFETIEAYNEKAGEVGEPYQFLVVSNFPTNFSETAARRLVSIASSGPRCGVHTLVSVDTKQTMPYGFDLEDLEAVATTFEWAGRSFVMADKDLARFPVRLDVPPPPAKLTEIVRAAGHQSKDARRVEVAFERIAPRDGNLWTQTSKKSLDIPLGRAGATKLQSLHLGTGTSQHVLIAGKTGSGKSSLLHTLITNLALNYDPNEVEFFLVDFKKGVEFKTYATHNFPHARIIGIESDREFGISVLERLDRVLKERGDLYRKYGAQDVNSYRKANPEGRLPRTLLVIDEFQEFFIEDDPLSQAATLLLDRLVRQGRAFGIHVLLGSQTLGGAYSLARSTLGQIAVRIALQCSESDAHLILSEENTAARLLTRPGEAIYNDANGLSEGNHPFQVAWLPDDTREFYLKKLQDQARTKGVHTEPPIVFEGNVASDPRNNPDVIQTIEAFAAVQAEQDGASQRIPNLWLGESVSIKTPPRIVFNQRPGDNLLIVGQEAASAHGMLALSLLTLAAQQKVAENGGSPAASFYVFDGDAIEASTQTAWTPLVSVIPQRTVRVGQKEADATVEEIAAEVSRRVESGGRERPIFVIVSNLTRFRNLRNEQDDFGFGGMGDSKPASPGKMLTDIFRDGPAVGVHAMIWCDTYSNLNRWMSNQTLKEFELRVSFQMNAADSSNLIDSPAASRLGPHRALLYMRETGSIDKIRPYAAPTKEWLAWVAAQFQKREPALQSDSPS